MPILRQPCLSWSKNNHRRRTAPDRFPVSAENLPCFQLLIACFIMNGVHEARLPPERSQGIVGRNRGQCRALTATRTNAGRSE